MSNPVRAFIILLAVAAGILAIVSSSSTSVDPSLEDERIGRAAPEFSLPPLGGGEPKALTDYAGQVVILDFWATHCAPCRRSIPHVERLGVRYADQGVVVVSVNVDFPDSARENLVQAFVRAQGMDAEVLMDDGRTAYQYGAARIPLLVMVDREGVIRRVYHGYTEYNRLADGLESILEG